MTVTEREIKSNRVNYIKSFVRVWRQFDLSTAQQAALASGVLPETVDMWIRYENRKAAAR